MSHVSILLVTLTHSQTAASPVTSDLSCPDVVRKEDVVVVMTRIEDVVVEKEAEEEEEKPTEEDGILINMLSFLLNTPQMNFFSLLYHRNCL